jgi:hypothetical protein
VPNQAVLDRARFRVLLSAVILWLSALACDSPADSVVGRWERIRERPRQQHESVQFESDGTFIARVGSDTSFLRGTYTQQGATVTITGNYTHTMTLRDSILVLDDGTEYRRIR